MPKNKIRIHHDVTDVCSFKDYPSSTPRQGGKLLVVAAAQNQIRSKQSGQSGPNLFVMQHNKYRCAVQAAHSVMAPHMPPGVSTKTAFNFFRAALWT
jgi:hypothetical protein